MREATFDFVLFALFGAYRINADFFIFFALSFKAYGAVYQRKQSVVGADAHVKTRMDSGSALTNQNVAGFCKLTVGSFGTQTFGRAVTTVVGATTTFL